MHKCNALKMHAKQMFFNKHGFMRLLAQEANPMMERGSGSKSNFKSGTIKEIPSESAETLEGSFNSLKP